MRPRENESLTGSCSTQSLRYFPLTGRQTWAVLLLVFSLGVLLASRSDQRDSGAQTDEDFYHAWAAKAHFNQPLWVRGTDSALGRMNLQLSTGEAIHVQSEPGVFPADLANLARSIRIRRPTGGQVTTGEIDRLEALAADFSQRLLNTSPETVVAVNPAVIETPGLINEDPPGSGWLVEIKLADFEQDQAVLLDGAANADVVKRKAAEE